MIAASAVELCAGLPVDAVQATVPPINDHDSVYDDQGMHVCIAAAFGIRSGNQSPHCDAERYLSRYDASPRGPVVRMTNGVNTLRAVKTSAGFTSRLHRRCRTDVAVLVR
ncbi:hypothetical protein LGM58_14985 [Burkholderia contaminans]|uniref:hypothetical protein n=1 Tax=Burkholderia contaminans TaxID=488447 RepID=UPI001CF54D1A|nr:hypothetical protein [Burkholderia contaminans]MCA7884501.1 hypothetical protein [Burkholderia contaminans]